MDWDYGEKGYVLRDYEAFPEGFQHAMYEGTIYPRSDWRELIELGKKNKTRPMDWHVGKGQRVLQQGRLGFCWAYGTISSMITAYSMSGIGDPYPDLNPHSTAAMGKRYRNQGGFAIEATRFVEKYGVSEYKYWPGHSMDRSLEKDPKVIASCKKHKLFKFNELPREDFDAVMSSLIAPDARPTTLAFSHWRHLVAGLSGNYRGSGRSIEWGLDFVNSWGTNWGSKGYGTLWGSKAIPFEAVRVEAVKPTVEGA